METHPFPGAASVFAGRGQADAGHSCHTVPLLDTNQGRLPGGNMVPKPALQQGTNKNIQYHFREGGRTDLTRSRVYKPSSVMEWRASPAQGKTLYKVTAGAGGTAAFPEESRKLISKLNKTLHNPQTVQQNPH